MRSRWTTPLLSTLMASAPLIAQATPASPVPVLAYQGRLLEATLPVTGTRAFTFSILDGAGAELWNSGAQSVAVNTGLYGVELGAAPMPAIPATVLAQPNLRLHVVVSGIALTPDTDLVPALQARSAFEVSGAFAGDVSGTQNAITLLRLQGIPLDLTTAAPMTGQGLVYNGTKWVPGTVSGAQGPAGPQGVAGPTGATGPAGPQGLTGATGIAGSAGAAGTNGINGLDGKTVRNGVGAPAATLGVDGDFYLNTATNQLYGPKGSVTAGQWPATGTSLVGSQGVTGATGPQGVAGPTGPQGIQGVQGLTGATGPQGPAGTTGIAAGSLNSVIGSGAFTLNQTGVYDSAFGAGALSHNTTGSWNAAFGASALMANDAGNYNSAVGSQALYLNTSGSNNVAFGTTALFVNTTGSNNSALGQSALYLNTTGIANTAVGSLSLAANTTASGNTAVGYQSLNANTTGTPNSALGNGSLMANTIGAYNTALGAGSLGANTTSSDNVAVGDSALGLQSFANGGALYWSWNTAVGTQALHANQPTATNNGNWNTAVGGRAMASNTTGFANTGVGMQCMDGNTTGSANSALGNQALFSNTTGTNNTALGWFALNANTTAGYNTAVGNQALQANTMGSPNTALGAGALMANTIGGSNTALGNGALARAITGSSNIAIGSNAGYNLVGAESNNIDIGHVGVTGDSGVIRIGTASQTTAFITGIRGVTTGQNNAIPVVIDSNGQLGTISSSIRFKEDVHDLGGVSSRIFQLRPVSFRYKGQAGNPHYGLIAEEVDQVMPELAVRGKDGQIETVAYQELPALLLSELQKQQKAIEQMEAQHQAEREALQVENADLRRQLAEIWALLQPRRTSRVHSNP